MYDSVASKPFMEQRTKAVMPLGQHKATLMGVTVRTYLEEDYLQFRWLIDNEDEVTQNFYINSSDPKKKGKACVKLSNLLLALHVPEETVKNGGFKDYDSLLNKRAWICITSFKNEAGEQINYIEKYLPLTPESAKFIEDVIPFNFP